MCDLYLRARRDGALTESQLPLAVQAEILQSAFARVGIAAVIDEATGYQKVRGNDALRLLLGRYIADGLRKWLNTFPDSFFSRNSISFMGTSQRPVSAHNTTGASSTNTSMILLRTVT